MKRFFSLATVFLSTRHGGLTQLSVSYQCSGRLNPPVTGSLTKKCQIVADHPRWKPGGGNWNCHENLTWSSDSRFKANKRNKYRQPI